MNTFKSLFLNKWLSLVFVAVASFVVIGCDGGGGDTGGGGSNDGGVACKSPPLNTNFSGFTASNSLRQEADGIAVFFVDSINSVLIGMTSSGDEVAILMSDIPFSGVFVGAGGIPVSETICDIILGLIDVDGDLDFTNVLLLPATGECRLEEDFSIFALDDFVIFDVPLGFNLRGECDEIVPLDQTTTSGASSKSIDSLNNAMLDKLQQISESRQITEEEGGLLLD